MSIGDWLCPATVCQYQYVLCLFILGAWGLRFAWLTIMHFARTRFLTWSIQKHIFARTSAQVSDGSRTVSGQPTLPFDSCSDQKFLITNNLPINNSPIFQARCQRKMRRAHYLRELWVIPVISLRIGSSDLNVVLHLFANEWCELRFRLVGKKNLHSIHHIESLGTCMEH